MMAVTPKDAEGVSRRMRNKIPLYPRILPTPGDILHMPPQPVYIIVLPLFELAAALQLLLPKMLRRMARFVVNVDVCALDVW